MSGFRFQGLGFRVCGFQQGINGPKYTFEARWLREGPEKRKV